MAIFCVRDISLESVAEDCSGAADFTLFFEELAFGLITQCIFLSLMALRAFQLRRRSQMIQARSHLGSFKLIINLAFVLSTIVMLVLNSVPPKSMFSIATASIEVVGSVGMAYLSRIEHYRTVSPSHFLQLFLSFFFLCDLVRIRTMFLLHFQNNLLSSMLLRTSLALLLLILESFDKKDLVITLQSAQPLGPEDIAGLFKKSFLWHLNSLFKKGTHLITR
jgi:ATP-binding cassette subfamily C (CFTR/MRP) protein 1